MRAIYFPINLFQRIILIFQWLVPAAACRIERVSSRRIFGGRSYPPSSTGKTLIVSTTSGNIVVPETDGALTLGINAYIKNPKYKAPPKV